MSMPVPPSAARPSRGPRPAGAVRLLAGTAAATAVALSAPASADLVQSLYLNEEAFLVRFTGMPDFDQRRSAENGLAGLPNDGAMYCAPTAVLNLGAYAANHGFPQVFEPRNWQSQTHYPVVTDLLQILGVIGGTDPFDGTGGDGLIDQAEALFLPSGLFTVTADYASLFWSPKASDIAQAVSNGAIVAVCHGWYTGEGIVVDRGGGHCLTFSRATAGTTNDRVWLRDPADSSADAVQSSFTDRVYTWEDSIYISSDDDDPFLRRMTRIFAGPSDASIRLIDGAILVRPRFGLTFQPGVEFPSIVYATQIHASLPLQVDLAPPPGDIASIVAGPSLDLAYASIQTVTGGYALHCTNLLQEPEWIELPVPLPGPADLLVAPDRSVLALGSGQLVRILVDAEDPDIGTSMAVPPNASMTIDPGMRRVVVLDPSARRLIFRSQDLEGPAEFVSIPGSGPFAPNAPLAWDSTRDGLWIIDGDELVLVRLVAGAPPLVSTPSLPGTGELQALQVDERGHLLVVDEGVWKEFAETKDGTWIPVDGPFTGRPADSRSMVTTSRTNFDPAIHDDESWRNVLPETFAPAVPDCPADLDLNEVVDFEDLVTLLGTWGPCPSGLFCTGDLDFDTVIGFGDLVELLAAWGDCG